jgi:hypothetical protein
MIADRVTETSRAEKLPRCSRQPDFLRSNFELWLKDTASLILQEIRARA